MSVFDIKAQMTRAQQHLDDAFEEDDTDNALNSALSCLESLLTVVPQLVDQTEDVQAVDAASEAQTDKDSA